jgi:hypothetical protein
VPKKTYLYLIIKKITFPWFGPSLYAFVHRVCAFVRPNESSHDPSEDTTVLSRCLDNQRARVGFLVRLQNRRFLLLRPGAERLLRILFCCRRIAGSEYAIREPGCFVKTEMAINAASIAVPLRPKIPVVLPPWSPAALTPCPEDRRNSTTPRSGGL